MKVLATHQDGKRTTVVNVGLVDFNTQGQTGVVLRSIKGRLLAGVTTSPRNDIPDVPMQPYHHQIELEDIQLVQVTEDDM